MKKIKQDQFGKFWIGNKQVGWITDDKEKLYGLDRDGYSRKIEEWDGKGNPAEFLQKWRKSVG